MIKYAYHFGYDYIVELNKTDDNKWNGCDIIKQYLDDICGLSVPANQISINNVGFELYRVQFNKDTARYAELFKKSFV